MSIMEEDEKALIGSFIRKNVEWDSRRDSSFLRDSSEQATIRDSIRSISSRSYFRDEVSGLFRVDK